MIRAQPAQHVLAPRLAELKLADEDRVALIRMANAWNDHPRPVLFVGAGLTAYHTTSKPGRDAKAFNWRQLAKIWINRFKEEGVTELPSDPLRLAQLYEQARGRADLLDTLEIAVPENDLDLRPAFREVVSIPWGAIVTTNYDALLERAFKDNQQKNLTIVRDADITRRRDFSAIPLVKMHGDFCHRDLITITEDDYNAYRTSRPAIAAKVDQLLLEHPILFVGFSLDDPNVSRILNWVRSTVGRLQLPSISIVHSRPSRPETELWASRGIRLVQCSEDVELAELLRGLNTERESPTPLPPNDDDDTRGADQWNAIQEQLRARAPGWQAQVAADLSALLEAIDRGILRISDRQVVQRRPIGVDWRPVLERLTHRHLTVLMKLLLTMESPFFNYVERTATDGGRSVHIPTGLLAFGDLSDDERIELASEWAGHWHANTTDRAMLHSVVESLRELRRSRCSPAMRARLEVEIRQLLFLLMDQDEIRAELDAFVLADEPFVLCRRGADFLLIGDVDKARQCYARARDIAHTGDEMHSAFFGLWECERWDSKVDQRRRAIPSVQKPLTTALEDRQETGNKNLLRGISSSMYGFVADARELGWPTSTRLHHIGPLETAVTDAAKVDLASVEQDRWREGIAWLLRVAMFEKDSISVDRFDELAAIPSGRAFLREWCSRRVESPRHKHSLSVFTLRCLDVLDDDEIDTVVQRIVIAPLTRSSKVVWADGASDIWEMLAKQAQRLPMETIERLLDVFPRMVSLGWNAIEHGLSVFVPHLWPIDEIRARSSVRGLVDALLKLCATPQGHDAFVRRRAFRLLELMADNDLLTRKDRRVAATTVRKMSSPESGPSGIPSEGRNLEVIAMLLDLGESPSTLAKSYATTLISGYPKIAYSSVLGQWCDVARKLGPFADRRVRVRLVECLMDAAKTALRWTRDDLLPDWSFSIAIALAEIAAVTRATVSAAAKQILVLSERFPGAAPAILGLKPKDDESIAAARVTLLRHVYTVHTDDDREAAIEGVVRWCQLSPDPDPKVLDALVAGIRFGGLQSRAAISWLNWLQRHGKVPSSYREMIAEVLLVNIEPQQPAMLRVSSLLALWSMTQGTTNESTAWQRIQELRKDPISIVRRGAEHAFRFIQRERNRKRTRALRVRGSRLRKPSRG